MHHQKPTFFTLVLGTVGIAACLAAVAASLHFGVYAATAVFGALALLAAWSLVEGLRLGVRAATPFERFEQRLSVWALVIIVGGGVLLGLVRYELADQSVLGLLALTCWLGASGYAATRLRRRSEAVAAYKRRVGYAGPE